MEGPWEKGAEVRLTANECDANQDGQNHEDDDPDSAVQICPELKEDTDGCNLRRNAEKVSIYQIPPNGKLQGGIDQKASMANETSGHLAEQK